VTLSAGPVATRADRALVVVAEDDADVRDLIVRKLSLHGLDVVAVSDGRAALNAITERRPDLALLDVMMPGLSGLEVCELLRAAEETAQLPVLFLTARAGQVDVAAGLAAGADDYVIKPFSPSHLVQRIRTHIGQEPR
jgi:DNA-binding response OmpR family regulator